jgi:hypothetical protein
MVASARSFGELTSSHLREDFVMTNIVLSTKKYFTCKITGSGRLPRGVPPVFGSCCAEETKNLDWEVDRGNGG